LQFGLSTKLIGYVMAGVLITSAGIGVVRVQNERGPLGEMIDKAGQSVANATASGAASLVAGYDYGNLEILAQNVAQQNNVIRVVIRNQSGRAMARPARRTRAATGISNASIPPSCSMARPSASPPSTFRPQRWKARSTRCTGACWSNRSPSARCWA
jgi:hypothetical protein